MRYFIVADVHGFYDEMVSALNNAGFDRNNENHIFISLGDAFDRGPCPDRVLEFMLGLNSDRRIFILGNHERLMEEAIARGNFAWNDYHNGTVETVKVLTGEESSEVGLQMMRTNPLYNEYLHSCRCYFETQHGIFVHGWIPHFRYEYWDRWRDATFEEWCDALWHNGMECWAEGVRESDRTIFCGHWHTSWARVHIDHDPEAEEWPRHDPDMFLPWENDGIVALDSCAAWSRFVNCYVFDDEPLGKI